MNSAALDVFGLAEKRLAWVDHRQAVLAQNIANANTPGYVAKDVKPFRDVLAEQAQPVTGGGTPFASGLSAVQDTTATAQSLNGNAVVVDEQMEKVAETDTDHQLAMNLLRKYMGLFRTAIGRN